MNHIRGQEFHAIINNIFDEVNGLQVSEQLQVNCPCCQEREGLSFPDGKFNLEINTHKRMFRCWKCDEPKFSGSLGRLIRIYGTSIDYDLYKSYASIYSEYSYEEDEKEYVPVKLPNEMILFSQMETSDTDHLEAYNYLVLERKISREIIYKYRLGFCITGKYSKRIIIPSYDKNEEINYFVARNYDKSDKKKKPYDNPKSNKDKIIFNEGFINWDSLVFLVEGVFDMLCLPNSIPLLGKNISTTLYFKLNEVKPKIVIVLDPDAWKDEMKIYDILKLIYLDDTNILVLNLKGKYDIDEIRKEYGNNEIIKLLYNARKLNDSDYFNRKKELN